MLKKKNIVILILSAALIILIAAAIIMATVFRPQSPIKPINFGATMGDSINAPIENGISDEAVSNVFGKTVKLYKIVEKSDKDIKKLKELYGFTDDTAVEFEGTVIYTNGEKRLTVSSTGGYTVQLNKSADDEFTKTLDQVETEATAFLEENDLLPQNFYRSGRIDDRINKPSGQIVTAQGVIYTRKIDGYKVNGGAISAVYDVNGLRTLMGEYSDYKYERKVTLKSFDEVFPLIGTAECENYFKDDVGVSNPEKIVIESAEIIYFDTGADGGSHLVPCYSFTGTAYYADGVTDTFYSTVQAV